MKVNHILFIHLFNSETPNKTSWLSAKNKVLGSKGEKKDEVFKAARELIRLKRKEKATDFITHVTMAKAYKPFKKFEGEFIESIWVSMSTFWKSNELFLC